MEISAWLKRWQEGKKGFHLDVVNPHLLEHWSTLGLEGNERVFVPLCGKSLDLFWLSDHGHSVVGVEASPLAIADLYKKGMSDSLGERVGAFTRYQHGSIEFLLGDYFDLMSTQLGDVEAVYDRAALVALSPEVQVEYVRHLLSLTKPGLSMLLVTTQYDTTLMDGPPFCVTDDRVEALFGPYFYLEKLSSADVIHTNQRFIEKGLSSFFETVWYLVRK